jgi:hypothetical protein
MVGGVEDIQGLCELDFLGSFFDLHPRVAPRLQWLALVVFYCRSCLKTFVIYDSHSLLPQLFAM